MLSENELEEAPRTFNYFQSIKLSYINALDYLKMTLTTLKIVLNRQKFSFQRTINDAIESHIFIFIILNDRSNLYSITYEVGFYTVSL